MRHTGSLATDPRRQESAVVRAVPQSRCGAFGRPVPPSDPGFRRLRISRGRHLLHPQRVHHDLPDRGLCHFAEAVPVSAGRSHRAIVLVCDGSRYPSGLFWFQDLWCLGLLLKSLLFVPAANADGRNWPTLYVGWTLDFEIFYAVFAVVLLLPRCFRVVTLAIVFGGLVVFHATFRSGNLIVVTYTDPIILEFIIGIVIGTIFGADLKKRSLGTSVLMSAALLLATFLVGHVLSALSFACIATALVIVALLLERLGRLPRSVALKSIGDASFSIYLFQQFAFDGVFVLLTAAALITKLPLATGHWTRPVAVVSAVLFGLAAYRSIERALMHVTRRFVMPVQVRAAR